MQQLGRYRIEARIGEGAMADVYRAYDPDIDRIVAIKALKAEFLSEPELAERFVREARAAGALNHPNIATIYDVGEADGVPYIAMELVEGRPLDGVLQAQGRIPFERVLGIAAQLSAALGYAHAQGIVHRDVKPSNILLSPDGATAKLLDFGVARMNDVESVGQRQLARTQFGQIIGTPRYMSPEQALGLPVDHRSDLFSLGAVLYEMVTGNPAFDAPGLATVALQIAREKVVRIESVTADCPLGLRQIIDKLLAKKPEQRFADGDQLSRAIESEIGMLTSENVVVRRGLSIRIKLPLALMSITLLALLLSISAILARQQHALEHMAISSGDMVATFVSKNAGVLLVDNAGLPPEQQDWAPLQAFVMAAGEDAGVRGIVVADADGVVRAATDPHQVGHRYGRPVGERSIGETRQGAVTDVPGKGALRFVRPIRYAGANFGSIDLLLPRTALDSAMDNARALLIALAVIVVLVVMAVGYLSAALVASPLRRLLQSFEEARDQGFALRISHKRRDEFGAVFDSFNRLAAAIEPRLDSVAPPPPLDATRIQLPVRKAA